ncbi:MULTISPECIES: DUF262 domain-containing protein [Halocynthiibacter]|uniref:DUF262 domain-containing HNH endonuclease family protein n=1 Tax=Halocynthiibacter halioticoli TaxID=2986804 RepID=A0AAE3LRY5_9RHOB|nr:MULTISPECIES: DUF262 domain-containing HNH endonuclease family protein [Halocynthiibacter]MCV6825148.1 DUF262 domain-containing HNH endonuclease family protein [Halocynthiibacter halioticoli]MCW4058149.1 DUF262 domain-containing HNH endonuclease family protein [Halocynthiibacter sp. SDUM655004]
MKTFSFDDIGIAKIFTDYSLTIPPHQRDYAWTEEEVVQLYSDLEAAYRKSSEYFLGTIVAIENEKTGELSVVDGQQRLTTTYLLLTAIRDFLQKNDTGKEISTSLQNTYLFNSDRREGFKQRLSLNTDDRHYFKQLTSKSTEEYWPPNESRTSHKLLREAYFLAVARVEAIANSVSGVDAPDTLNNWIDYLERSAQVILLRAHDQARAFKMFETLNDRGLRTSQADLVKSYLFGHSDGQVGLAQSKWSNMLENLQELGDDDPQVSFLRHYLIAFSGFVRADGVYDAIQTKYKTEGTAVSFLTSLADTSRIYTATFNAENEFWDDYSPITRKYLEDFNFFNLKPIRPLILATSTKFEKSEFEKTIKFLTSFSLRLVVSARTRSGANEQAFADAAIKVTSGDISNYIELTEALKKISVSDKDFEEIFANARVTKTALARYLLRELEHTCSPNKGEKEWVNSDPQQVTLEHILPKSIRGIGWDSFNADSHSEFKNRLGNLCLLKRSENNGMSNESFEGKKPFFEKSSLTLTYELSKTESWEPIEVENRQKKLAKLALRTWPSS